MRAFQSPIALNAKVAGFLVSYLSHYFSSVVLILLGQCEMRMTIFSHTRSAQSDTEPRRTTPAGIPNDQHRSGWTKGKEGMEGSAKASKGHMEQKEKPTYPWASCRSKTALFPHMSQRKTHRKDGQFNLVVEWVFRSIVTGHSGLSWSLTDFETSSFQY